MTNTTSRAALVSVMLALMFVALISMPHAAHAATVQGTNWTGASSAASWSGRRTFGTTAVLNSKLWVVGGYDGSRLSDVWYSSDGDSWTEATSSAEWTARAENNVLAYNNKLWVFAGNDQFGSKFGDVWYSTDGATWVQATSTAEWAARDGAAAATFNSKMWIMGGQGGSGKVNDVWYSTDGIVWTEATSSADWSARYAAQLISFNNKLWLMGGNDGSAKNDVWYSTDGITWTEATSSADWPARYNAASAVFDGKMWIIGGDDGSGAHLNDVWYSTDGITWTEATSSADWVGRQYSSAQAFDNRLLILGGVSSSSFLNDVWYTQNSYDLSFDAQGGSSVSSITDKLSGASVTLPAAPTKSGYTFDEWNSTADGSGTSYSAGDSYIMTGSTITLYAIWTAVESTSRRSGGTSVQSQVKNLTDMGNTTAADELKAQWPQLFGSSAAGSASSSSMSSASIRDLELGMTGDDVLALQKLLNANGSVLAESGVGSAGNETTYFGSLTKAALAKYQAANSIAPAAGYFGSITQAQMKAAGLSGIWW